MCFLSYKKVQVFEVEPFLIAYQTYLSMLKWLKIKSPNILIEKRAKKEEKIIDYHANAIKGKKRRIA